MNTDEKISNIFADVKTILFRLDQKDNLCIDHSGRLKSIEDKLLVQKVENCYEKRQDAEFKQETKPALKAFRDWKGFWAVLSAIVLFLSTTSYIIVKVNAITKSMQLNTITETKIKEEIKTQLEKDLKELLSKNSVGVKEP
jgi:hypothetical protein